MLSALRRASPRRQPYSQLLVFLALEGTHQRDSAMAMLQCFARFFPEDLPGLSEPYISWKALEELSLQTNLHAADLPRQRRLCDMASLCGPSEAALLGDRQEILHLPQLDLYPHLINVSEKEGVDYCFFEPTIASKAIIEKFP
jgi:hypothetical protein